MPGPYDERLPVLCFDEQPCFLIGDTLAPVPMEPGRVAKQDYEYERFGSGAVLLAVEPRTGRRFVKVCARRTAEEYTAFMQELERAYPEAVQITLVQDNLNTHHGGSFYKWMPPDQAHRLVGRFEWIYTPKHACLAEYGGVGIQRSSAAVLKSADSFAGTTSFRSRGLGCRA